MATQKQVKTGSEQSSDLEEKLQKLREIYADASEIGKTALENVIRTLKSAAPAKEPAARIESAGRIGRRQGKVSELTVIVPLAPGGAKRLRSFLDILHGSIGNELGCPNYSAGRGYAGSGRRPPDRPTRGAGQCAGTRRSHPETGRGAGHCYRDGRSGPCPGSGRVRHEPDA